MAKTEVTSIEEYIRLFPESTQAILQRMRERIRMAVPEAEEGISYQIPAFKVNGRYFIYFSGYKQHVSLYPAPSFDAFLKGRLAPYLSGKGTVKFPIDKPVPYHLVEDIAKALRMRKMQNSR